MEMFLKASTLLLWLLSIVALAFGVMSGLDPCGVSDHHVQWSTVAAYGVPLFIGCALFIAHGYDWLER